MGQIVNHNLFEFHYGSLDFSALSFYCIAFSLNNNCSFVICHNKDEHKDRDREKENGNGNERMETTETQKNNTFLIFYSTSIDFYGQFVLVSLSLSLPTHSSAFSSSCSHCPLSSQPFILHFTCAPCFIVLFDKWFACHNLFNFLPCPRVSCILAFFKN